MAMSVLKVAEKTLAACALALLKMLRAVRRRHRWLLAYVLSEGFCYWRFRMRMRRLLPPRVSYRRGSMDDLRWMLKSTQAAVAPLTLNKESMAQYVEEVAGKSVEMTWEHYYAMVQDTFCILGPSPEEHSIMLKIASAFCATEGLLPPPDGARPPHCKAPVAFGSSPIHVQHKPLPVEILMLFARTSGDAVLWFSGYRPRWQPTAEGWMRYWVSKPRDSDPQLLPMVFLHGVGLGAVPYIFFLERLRRRRKTPLVLLELPNASRCSFQNAMPSPAAVRDVMERLLREDLGIVKPGRYVLLGHSLGTDVCSIIMNDPRMIHDDPPARPAKLVMMDPVSFAHEIAQAHRLPFWTIKEALAHAPTLLRKIMQIPILLMIIRDEYNQEACKRFLTPGTDVIFRCSPSLLRLCPCLVCLSGKDQALPAWKIHDYVRAHFPQVEVRMDPNFEHGMMCMPWTPEWLSRHYLDEVLRFVGQDEKRRHGSHPHLGLEPLLPLRGSRSDVALSVLRN
uniref:AB hydrolase-1 domain-containing protein n=1 Tax=Noctiluca scintillans TaxID=2966 RepID=A0A7S1AET2_NOCSC|mmetsp:Transcript_43313/g.113979  ORF Transcript_43313/g.113979 Transcript_43313/m.113979 type:complete len:507 (+) Transcript_43313:40-1560(+)